MNFQIQIFYPQGLRKIFKQGAQVSVVFLLSVGHKYKTFPSKYLDSATWTETIIMSASLLSPLRPCPRDKNRKKYIQIPEPKLLDLTLKFMGKI